MLWLLVILILGGMAFVMFHKPRVNNVVGFAPPMTHVPQPETPVQAQPPAEVSTFDLNDLYRPTTPPSQGSDRPTA